MPWRDARGCAGDGGTQKEGGGEGGNKCRREGASEGEREREKTSARRGGRVHLEPRGAHSGSGSASGCQSRSPLLTGPRRSPLLRPPLL
eukprot:1441815-Rhodomonas_salina.2